MSINRTQKVKLVIHQFRQPRHPFSTGRCSLKITSAIFQFMQRMAVKRFPDGRDGDDGQDPFGSKKLRRLPSFESTVIKEAVTEIPIQNWLTLLEPMLRRVVQEEVHQGLVQVARSLEMTPQRQTQAREEPSWMRLEFAKKLSLPIFTSSKIEDEESNPLQVHLVVDGTGEEGQLPLSMKLEIFVVNGDFAKEATDDWTPEEFERNIVRERSGKRPLLTGDVKVVMKDGVASMDDLVITDNSSWIRCRHFRIGARVAAGSGGGFRIREALSERFTVKDHRGELYKKSYPPSLDDEVWRLERIGKDGAFHRRMSAAGIETVQDFLKHWVADPLNLKRILGQGMSDRTWETTTAHAKTCILGSKVYVYRKLSSVVLLNPIGEVVGVLLDGITVSLCSLAGPPKAFVEQMIMEARGQWKSLEERDEMNTTHLLSENITMLQGLQDDVYTVPSYTLITGDDVFPANEQADYRGSWYSCPVNPNPLSPNNDSNICIIGSPFSD